MNCNHDHSKEIALVNQDIPSEEILCEVSDLYKVFGDTTRMKILYALSKTELSVCAIAEAINMQQSAVSHQLKVLRDFNLVGNRREGKTVYYFLADNHVYQIINQGIEHILEGEHEHEKDI